MDALSRLLQRTRYVFSVSFTVAVDNRRLQCRRAVLVQNVSQASELRERLAKGESVTALATEYGISRQTVYNYKIA